MSIFHLLLAPLNTPIKRIGGIIFFAGLLWLVAGMITAEPYNYRMNFWHLNPLTRALTLTLDAVMKPNDFYLGTFWYLRFAVYTTFLGLMLSYLYDMFIGRLIKWVQGSKPPQ